jgi:hypothetical protein
MKQIFILIYFFSAIPFTALSESHEIKLEGTYQGENIYVQNPFAETGLGFCVYEVLVNNQVTLDEINSSAFEIDLSVYKFKIGDPIVIVIKHKEGCFPKVLNPEVLSPKSTFKITKINVDRSGMLQWITTGESGKLPYTVEQYRWKKWQNVGTVGGKGNLGENNYSIAVSLHTGVNQFRVKQTDYTNKPRYSPEVTFRNLAAPITFQPGDGNKTSGVVTFSDKTKYEIYDYYGSPVLKGEDKKIDVSKLKPGNYFLNYDNQTASFVKK